MQVDPLSSGLHSTSRTNSNKNVKKSLASRISNGLERFKRSSSLDKSASTPHVSSRGLPPTPGAARGDPGNDNFSPHFRPRRTFYNVIPPRANVIAGSMRGPSSSSRRSAQRYFVHPPVSASVTPIWPQQEGTPPAPPHFIHGGGDPVNQQPHFVHRTM